jgi:hypothetical protein
VTPKNSKEMPVEIRELVIRATVSANNAPSSAATSGHTRPTISGDEALIQACVSQVMLLLEKQKER